MKTREVKREGWEDFCNKVNASLMGSTVRIQQVGTDGSVRVVAEKVPLRRITFQEQKNECNDLLVIEAGEQGDRGFEHVVTEPIHIRLKDGDNDRYNHLQILAESGTTLLDMNPGLTSSELEDLQTA